MTQYEEIPATCEEYGVCVFDAPPDEDDEESWHFLRTCLHCGHQWQGLHCRCDRRQNRCPACLERPTPVPCPCLDMSDETPKHSSESHITTMGEYGS